MWISTGRQTITLSMIYEPRGGETGEEARRCKSNTGTIVWLLASTFSLTALLTNTAAGVPVLEVLE